MSRLSGDDASCLNLNRVSNPSLLGVETSELVGRFDFQTVEPGTEKDDQWLSLKKRLPGGVIPAVADQTVIQWGLGMKTGDTLLYLGEKGDTLRLKLSAGLFPSVFQGYILIDQRYFRSFYPSRSGSSVFLIDSREERVKDSLADLFRENGMEIISASEKLAIFQSVTNTYLSIFMALGFLALALGTLGILVVVARSLLERRQEIAILEATGFTRRQLVQLVVMEYSGILAVALLAGLLSAVLSLLPAALTGTLTVSLVSSAFVLLGILLHCLLWIRIITQRQIIRGKLIQALHFE
jgi:ABC-type antimicrobial peptide transport system permease subunit